MKIKYIIPVIIASVMFASCHKDLDVTQTSQLSAASMWTDQNDAIAGMYGAHQFMRTAFNQSLVYWGEYRTGLWGPGNHKGLSQTARDQVYQSTMANTHSHADWENLYRTINMANLVLKYTPGIAFSSDQKKNEVLANAHYVRAVCYYWIARVWGDAPMVLEGYESAAQELHPLRSTAEQIFAQVKSDIESGISLMPSSVTEKKTASLASLNMLKADFSLWMYKVRNAGDAYLQDAATAVAAVKATPGLGLETDYSRIFSSASEGGREVIYAFNYAQDEHTGGYPADYQFNSATVSPGYHFNPIVVGTGQQWTFYTDEYVDVLTANPADTRLNTTYQTFYDNLMGQMFHWTNKYRGTWLNNTLVLDSDIIMYRLADAYMYEAEIKYYQNDYPGAVAAVNQLVQRAYGTPNYYPASLNQAEVKDMIVKERMREFPSEGKLWWDFIRLDVVFDMNPHLAAKQNQPNILFWPLSNNSLNDNPNLSQTEGWE